MTGSAAPFDRALWRARRDRAAARLGDADFLIEAAVARLAERLEEVNRAFPRAAVVGAGTGAMARALQGRFGVETLVQLDGAPAMAARAARACPGALTLVGDEEASPLGEGAFDLIVAPLTLHWVNDLPGALIQMRRALKPDGLLLAALFAGRTLSELRACLAEAEIAVEGGLSPRVAPMADLRDLGGLLQRADLALPVADHEPLTVRYDTPFALMRDLRAMGETNAMHERRRTPMRRETLMRACALYQEKFADPDGRIRATFDLAFLHGWAPAPDQPKPLRPGSATARLADALGTTERSAGEKAGR